MKYRTRLLLVNSIPIVLFAVISLLIGFQQFRSGIYAAREEYLKAAALAAMTLYSSHGYGDYGWKADGNVWRGMNFNVSAETSLVDELKEQTGADITFFLEDTPIMTSIYGEAGKRFVGTTAIDSIKAHTLSEGTQLWCSSIEINGIPCQAYVIPIRQEKDGRVVGAMMASQPVYGFNSIMRDYIMTTVLVMLVVLLAVFLVIRRYASQFSEEFTAIKDKSCQDLLTGLYNKASFEDEAVAAMQAKGPGDVPVLLLFDFDNFKQINDNYGHQIGDEVLRAFAHVLIRAFRTKDILGRVGGDEFMVYMPHMSAAVIARTDEVAQEVLEELAKLEIGPAKHFSCSIGIGTDPGGHGFKHLYSVADRALYEAKEKGKACYVRH